jgi:hypothetical protein
MRALVDLNAERWLFPQSKAELINGNVKAHCLHHQRAMNVVLVLLALVLALAVGTLELLRPDLPLQRLLPILVNGDQQNPFHTRHDQMEVYLF